jgi:hypothetical protein
MAILVPTFTIPPNARTRMWQILPLNAAQWALGGFYLSLGPSLARLVTDSAAAIIGGNYFRAPTVACRANSSVPRTRLTATRRLQTGQ